MAPRLNLKFWPRLSTIRSFLAIILPTRILLLSRQASPHSGDLLLKFPAMSVHPTDSLRLSSRRRIRVTKTSNGSFEEKKQMYTHISVTSTQTNFPSLSRMSSTPQSRLHTRIPVLLDASWVEISDHLYCSLISNTSGLLSLSVCIGRSWASFPLLNQSWRKFTSCTSTLLISPRKPDKNRFQEFGWHIFLPYPGIWGTSGVP